MKTYVKMRRPYPTDSIEGYTRVTGAAKSNGGGFISASKAGNGTGRIPTACAGSDKGQYQCDRFVSSNTNSKVDVSACYRCRGGIWYRGYTNHTNGDYGIGAGLTYEPPAE